jgi:hypothetical protein
MGPILHGGFHPWQLLQPMLEQPLITSSISFLYNLWFFVMFTVVLWQAWSQNLYIRMRFLWSFVLLWVLLGTIAAILLSSAGPCYYGRVTGLPDPYAPLMDYLRHVSRTYPVWALGTQEQLWLGYKTGGTHLVGGISAMPSLHIATSVLFALVGWKASPYLGIALTFFAIVIQIGSVHLGWHYAIDGYFAAVCSIGIWWTVGTVLRRARYGQLSQGQDGILALQVGRK